MLYFYVKKMEIDNIILLRTLILLFPFFLLGLFFHYKVKDLFFLKPRTHIQLNMIMIGLVIVFLELVYWNLSLRNYAFMGFGLSVHGAKESSNTILVLLGIVAAILGWLFPTRASAVASTRNHSIQTLMESRLSETYIAQVEICTELFVKFKKEKGEGYNLSQVDFDELSQKQKYAIHYLLNYLEFVAVGIRFGDLDENLMKNMMKSIINTNFNFFGEIIVEKQKKSSTVYEHLTALYKRWNCIK